MFSYKTLNKWYEERSLSKTKKLFIFLDENGEEIEDASFYDLDVAAKFIAYYLHKEKKLKFN